MTDNGLISADSHVVEPADMWRSRIAPAYRDRAPVARADAAGTVHWFVDGDIALGSVGAPSQAGVRFDRPEDVTFEATWEDVRPGCNDPLARLEDMARDGVVGEVVYPTLGARLYGLVSAPLLTACCRAQNDWMADFCNTRPHVYKGICMLDIDHVGGAVEELARCARRGLAGAMIPTYPGEERPYDDRAYDPLWAAAQDHAMPLSFHVASARPGPGHVSVFGSDGQAAGSAAYRCTQDYWVRRSIACMIFAGVFERFPGLRVAIVEHELAWAPFFLTHMDRTYKELSQTAPYRFADQKLPSDFFRANIFISFQEDKLGVEAAPPLIGSDTIIWGSDYPHAESTWPNSRAFLETVLANVPEADRRRFVHDNVARLYGFQ
jgi:predicted TIM-barrel fold metal-dependent hydrolase